MQPIDKTSSVPYYLQLAELLQREIDEQQSPQEIYQLPSENELASRMALLVPRSGAPWMCWSEMDVSIAKRAKARSLPCVGSSTN